METKRQSGFILLMLLVVIAIAMMIYYMDIMWMDTDVQMLKDQQKQEPGDKKPWDYENLIRKTNESKSQAATEPNRVIEGAVKYTGIVSKDSKRGPITLVIEPDGTVTGSWQCQYDYSHAAYEITATFTGNTIDKQNHYKPEELYLVAKGGYIQQATNLDTGEVTEIKGTVYVNGSRKLSGDLRGTLSITTDKKWHVDYKWMAVTK